MKQILIQVILSIALQTLLPATDSKALPSPLKEVVILVADPDLHVPFGLDDRKPAAIRHPNWHISVHLASFPERREFTKILEECASRNAEGESGWVAGMEVSHIVQFRFENGDQVEMWIGAGGDRWVTFPGGEYASMKAKQLEYLFSFVPYNRHEIFANILRLGLLEKKILE